MTTLLSVLAGIPLLIRGLTLPGAASGLIMYASPDPSKLSQVKVSVMLFTSSSIRLVFSV